MSIASFASDRTSDTRGRGPGNAVAEDATVKFTRGPVKVTYEIRRLRPVTASAIVLPH